MWISVASTDIFLDSEKKPKGDTFGLGCVIVMKISIHHFSPKGAL